MTSNSPKGPMDIAALRGQIRARIRLYHFTDTKNLDSIRQHGALFSLEQTVKRGITITAPGGDANSQLSDRSNGMDRYVHLCLRHAHPMEYRARTEGRIQQSVFIPVKAAVLDLPGVRFVPGMSNTRGISPLAIDEAIEQGQFAPSDLVALYDWTDWGVGDNYSRRVRAEKFEIIVPDMIPLELLDLLNG